MVRVMPPPTTLIELLRPMFGFAPTLIVKVPLPVPEVGLMVVNPALFSTVQLTFEVTVTWPVEAVPGNRNPIRVKPSGC